MRRGWGAGAWQRSTPPARRRRCLQPRWSSGAAESERPLRRIVKRVVVAPRLLAAVDLRLHLHPAPASATSSTSVCCCTASRCCCVGTADGTKVQERGMLQLRRARTLRRQQHQGEGGVEKDCEATQEMDADMQGQVEGDNWKLERGPGEEGPGASPNRMVLKKRRISMKMAGPGAPEARGEMMRI